VKKVVMAMRGRVARPHQCTVVVVGDCKVGKTALVNRFCQDSFNENYTPTSFNRQMADTTVANKRVRYTVWDTSGHHDTDTTRILAFREADVFLLCYKISDPSSLFSAINHWVPELSCHAPATPIVLVGCQSDLRTDRTVLQGLANQGKAPVSSQQALAFSQQIEAVMYVETSAKASGRGVASAMEVAALTSLGQFSPPAPGHVMREARESNGTPLHHRQSSLAACSSPSPMISKKHRNRSLSVTRQKAELRTDLRAELRNNFRTDLRPEMGLTRESQDSLYTIEPEPAFWDQFQSPKNSPRHDSQHGPPAQHHNSPLPPMQQQHSPPPPTQGQHRQGGGDSSPRSPRLITRSKMGSLSSMRSKSSTLSSTKSDSSMLSVSTTKTPKTNRKTPEKDKGEKMVIIKCQRLTADKTYEEVEIEVPVPVYETMQAYTENGNSPVRGREKRGIGTKIKCLFSKTS